MSNTGPVLHEVLKSKANNKQKMKTKSIFPSRQESDLAIS